MSCFQRVLWLFIALCTAVFAICAYLEPDRLADSLEHVVFNVAYVSLLAMLVDVALRYKE